MLTKESSSLFITKSAFLFKYIQFNISHVLPSFIFSVISSKTRSSYWEISCLISRKRVNLFVSGFFPMKNSNWTYNWRWFAFVLGKKRISWNSVFTCGFVRLFLQNGHRTWGYCFVNCRNLFRSSKWVSTDGTPIISSTGSRCRKAKLNIETFFYLINNYLRTSFLSIFRLPEGNITEFRNTRTPTPSNNTKMSLLLVRGFMLYIPWLWCP